MPPRILVALLPVVVLVTACSSTAAAPTWTYAPTSAAVASPTTAASASVAIELASPSAPIAAVALTGEVPVTMTDAMRFVPDPITVKAGKPITFVVRNTGLIVHEFFVGTEAEQVDHAAEMAMGEMSHGHDNALSVEAGETGSLTMTFAEAGSLLVGCHEPGHYHAGMKATLTVVD